jgi:hypothetical protein
VAGHEGPSGEIKVIVLNLNPRMGNQEAVVLDLVKLSLSYMILPLCSVISFQEL